MVLALCFSGVFFTVYFGFPQLRLFKHANGCCLRVIEDPRPDSGRDELREVNPAVSSPGSGEGSLRRRAHRFRRERRRIP
jgi:hypothetical protein